SNAATYIPYSAVSGPEYSLAAGTLTIAAGATSGVITGALSDRSEERRVGQAFTSKLAGAPNATLGSTASTVVTVSETDAMPVAQLASDSATFSETDGTFDLTVTLSSASNAATYITYSAVSGAEYSLASGTLTIAAGATSGVITGTLSD